MTNSFAKTAWLRFIDSVENYYEVLSLEAQDELLNPLGSPARSDDVQLNDINSTNSRESRLDDVADVDNEWNLEGADGLDDMERVGIKRQFWDLQESRCVKLWKVSGTVAEAVKLADKLFKQAIELGTQVANNAAHVKEHSAKSGVVSLLASIMKIREEAVSAKTE